MKTQLAALLVFVPNLALAHPGHGETAPESWTHYLTEPMHVLSLAMTVSLIVGAGVLRRRRRPRTEGARADALEPRG